ncbi:MAG TPA: efflux RND transporter permease subunit [Terriglobales bacterium]|nr:efflux RND transporter permease subunit [Terriglobales bacterium]
MNLVRVCHENRKAVYLLTAMMVVGGLFALFQLPSNIYPELSFPRVVVLAHTGDLAPDSMLISVTRPLEEEVRGVQGVRRVRSSTIRGNAEISVLFEDKADMQVALQLVQARVNDTRGSLPAETELRVERLSPSVFPILSFVLNGNVPNTDLYDRAFYNLRPAFSSVPGVAQVEVQSSNTREILVIVDPQKVLAHRLALPDVADRLRATNAIISVGRLDKNYLQFLVLTSGQFTSLDQIRNTVVGTEGTTPIRVTDIAEVKDGVADPATLIYGNGKPAAILNITRQVGASIITIAQQLKDVAAHSSQVIPATLHLSVVYDLAEFVQEAIGSVRDAILIGAFLAVVILFLFLREVRTTFITATSLPLTVVGTFLVMRLFGSTLNLMSLGGLAVAIGLVIDDAVVVVENIYRHIGKGESSMAAAENGTHELIGPVIGSTITTVVVFAPLGLLQGAVGNFFSALSLTLSASVLLSLLFALTLVPLLSEQFLTPARYRESSARFIEPLYRIYEKALRWSLAHKYVVGGIAAASLLFTVLIYTFYTSQHTGFLPEMDEGGFVIDYLTPPGTSLAETNRLVSQIEDIVKKTPEVDAFSRRTGAEMGLYATEQNKGDVLVKLKPASQRSRSADEIINDLRDQITKTIPSIDVEFIQVLQDMIGDLEGTPEEIEVKIFGDNMPQLESLADEIGPKVQQIPGVVDFKGLEKGNPELIVQVDPVQAARVGMTIDQVSQQMQSGLKGVFPTEFRESDRTIPVHVRFPDGFRYDFASVQQFPILTPAKQIVPISSLAQVSEIQGENKLQRENQHLMVVLTARLDKQKSSLGAAIPQVQKALGSVHFPVGYTYEIGGQYESQQSSFKDLLTVLGFALAAVLIVLVFQFRSFQPAVIILSAAPLSLFGVFGMLMITGTALNVSSFMGVILMVGLVVKNGIILFEYVHQLRDNEGLPLIEALVSAGRIRMRPILMTTLCTLFGLLPLALGLGSGAELQKPLALAVIGGLTLSTFITLLVMPVFYALLERRQLEPEPALAATGSGTDTPEQSV